MRIATLFIIVGMAFMLAWCSHKPSIEELKVFAATKIK